MTDETENVLNDETPEVEPVEAPEEKKKDHVKERIDAVTRQKYEAIQERDLYKKKIEELEAKLNATVQKPVEAPTLENFGYDEDAYQQALIDQRAEAAAKRLIEQRDAEKTKIEQETQQLQRAREFASKEAAFSQQMADYDQVARNPMLPINNAMAEIIQTSDAGPAIAYHLGKHPDQAYQIAQMDPISAQRALLRIEAGFNKPKLVSDAPDPVPDIGGSDVPDVDMDKLPVEEWIKRRNRQVYGK